MISNSISTKNIEEPKNFTVNFQSKIISNLTLKVSDSNGKLIYSDSEKKFSGHYVKTIDLRGQPKGTYFVEMGCGEYKRTKKIILE